MEEETKRIVAEQITRNSRPYTSQGGVIEGRLDKFVLQVLPQDLLTTIRAVAVDELQMQERLYQNRPSQIIVDNQPVTRRGIWSAMRRVRIRFQDTKMLIAAIEEAYRILQQVTRLQSPPKNSIVARQNFYLWLNGVNLGLMPQAVSKIRYEGVLTDESVVRIVGPLVDYGRKLFWNPVGASSKMSFYRTKSKKNGVRFLPLKGSSIFSPRFKPYANRTLRRKANATSTPALTLAKMLAGDIPPGRVENTGQIVKRIMARNPAYRGLHFSDGWVEHAPAIGWSKLRDPRVPAFGVMFSKRGKLPNGE